jgi:hypothetical protein
VADERVDRKEMLRVIDIQGKEDAIQCFLEALNTWVECYGRFFGAIARASGALRGRKSSPLLQY